MEPTVVALRVRHNPAIEGYASLHEAFWCAVLMSRNLSFEWIGRKRSCFVSAVAALSSRLLHFELRPTLQRKR